MKDRKLLFTAFAIFLLMGAAPLHASRVEAAESAARQHAIGHQDRANLDMQNKIPFVRTSCDTLQQNFLRLGNESRTALTSMQNGETLSFAAKVSLAMKMRGMLRASRRAASNECAWLGDSNVVDFQQQVASIAAMSPCFSTAQQIIQEANGLGKEEQEAVAVEAVQIMMSPTCELPEDDEGADEDDEILESEEAGDEVPQEENGDLSELNADNTMEEDEILEEVDELSEELTAAALENPNGASLLQENEGQVETVIVGAFMAVFFGIFFLIWLPFLAIGACLITGLGFLVFSLIGCLLFNLLSLIVGRVPSGCPMLNWLPHCPALFDSVARNLWGADYATVSSTGVGYAYGSGGVAPGGYAPGGYVAPGYVAPGYVAPVVASPIYYDRRRRMIGIGGSIRRNNRRIRRANRRANRHRRANRRVNRARRNRRARRARRGRR